VAIKKRGTVEWIRLPGSGNGGAWTDEEIGREAGLHEALSARDDRLDPLARARAAADLRWRPLRPALVGIDRIIVTRFTERSTRCTSLSKIPIDLLIEVGSEPGDRRPVVIEGLSGSVYARKRKSRNDRDPANGRILVVANPSAASPNRSRRSPPRRAR
jgi:hypothetical protein